eukprot:jgi/Orpsp1_1/1178001/evm.model.c7180000063692.1
MESDNTYPESSSYLSTYSDNSYDHSRNRKRLNRRRQLESSTVINKPIEEYQFNEVFPGININAPIKINKINHIEDSTPPVKVNNGYLLNDKFSKIDNSLNKKSTSSLLINQNSTSNIINE